MRFKRHFRPSGSRPHSAQRVVAARRAIQKEQDQTPLFPTFFYDESVEERLTHLDASAEASAHAMRAYKARQWRKARAKLQALPEPQRRHVLATWNQHRFYPGTPEYLLDLLRHWQDEQ